jgi:hypothetical protein
MYICAGMIEEATQLPCRFARTLMQSIVHVHTWDPTLQPFFCAHLMSRLHLKQQSRGDIPAQQRAEQRLHPKACPSLLDVQIELQLTRGCSPPAAARLEHFSMQNV